MLLCTVGPMSWKTARWHLSCETGSPITTCKQTLTPPICSKKRDLVTLNLDYKQMGVGGDTSWGAVIHPQYRLPAKEYSYTVRLRPFSPEDQSPMKLSKQKF